MFDLSGQSASLLLEVAYGCAPPKGTAMRVLKVVAFLSGVVAVAYTLGIAEAILGVVTFGLGLMFEHHLHRANISIFSREPLSKARNSTWATPGPSLSGLFVGILALIFLSVYAGATFGLSGLTVVLVALLLGPAIEYRAWLHGKSLYGDIVRRFGG